MYEVKNTVQAFWILWMKMLLDRNQETSSYIICKYCKLDDNNVMKGIYILHFAEPCVEIKNQNKPGLAIHLTDDFFPTIRNP